MANERDIENLSHAELQVLAEKVQSRIGELHRSRRSEVRGKVQELIRSEGFTFDELYGSPRTGKSAVAGQPRAKGTVKPKYRNPADESQTWTGRGKRPRWFQAALTGGKKESDFLI